MNAIGFEYLDYEDPAANAEAKEKRKRVDKGAGKASKKAVGAGTKNDESEGDDEPYSGPKRKRPKLLQGSL